MGRCEKARMIRAALVMFFFLPILVSGAGAYLIVDHTCTDIDQIPAYWINEAKSSFRVSYGHSSHGSQIVTGMALLRGSPGSLYWVDEDGTESGLSFHDWEPSGDLGSPDRTTWAQLTRDLLDTPGNDRNLIMWAWCGQVSYATEADITTYLDLMSELEADYPNVTFIYMTGHLDGSGEEGNLHRRNNQIRSHVIAHNGVLFDFADIESYDPDGNYFLDRGADDGCYYDGGNWAEEWCAGNPGECVSCTCAHSHCLNCQLKGKAFWWMMAKLAGWESAHTTSTTTADSSTSSTTTIEGTTTSAGSTTTTDVITTTTVVDAGCSIILEPGIHTLHSKESLTFTVTEAGDCNEPDYQWSIESDIESSIDQSGQYRAGLHSHVFKAAVDIVRVVDRANESIVAEAVITVRGCPLSMLYGEYSEEAALLRAFRDNVLRGTSEGRELIRLYYRWSPLLVMAMEENEDFKAALKETLDTLLPSIGEMVQ